MSALSTHGRRGVLAVLGFLVALMALPAAASAHTDFEGSTPSDGQRVTAPVDRVRVSFTNPASPSGDGFVLLDGTGRTVPSIVKTTDDTEYAVVPEESLEPGSYGVRWEVRAGDAHPIEGSFTFTVTGAPAESAQPPPGDSDTPADPTEPAAPTLEQALEGDSDGAGTALAPVARTLVIAGSLLALGGLAALLWVVRGGVDELARILTWVRVGGGAVAVGGALQLWDLAGSGTGGPTDFLTTSAGIGALLRVVGGLVVVAAPSGRALPGDAARRGRHAVRGPREQQWVPTRGSAPAVVGALLVLAAFWFDGHTVTRGPWVLHAAVNAVHVTAGAVWSGGLVVLAALVWRRWRRRLPQDGAWLVARFSQLAGVALAAVVLAGVTMAVLVLDSPQGLWETRWGQVLVAKTSVVAVAAALGAVTNVRLRPALQEDPSSHRGAARVRRSFAAESGTFVVVLGLTVWLVAAAT
jgi:copper transport protein